MQVQIWSQDRTCVVDGSRGEPPLISGKAHGSRRIMHLILPVDHFQ